MALDGRIKPDRGSTRVDDAHDAVSVEHLAVDCKDVAAVGVAGEDKPLGLRDTVNPLVQDIGLLVELAPQFPHLLLRLVLLEAGEGEEEAFAGQLQEGELAGKGRRSGQQNIKNVLFPQWLRC